MHRVEVLRKSDLFRELDDEQLRLVAKLGAPQEFETGTILHKQGTIGDRIHVIEEGLVAIILEVGPMAQRQVQSAANFESVGWVAVIPPYTCTATSKTLEKTKTISFDGQELLALCSKEPELGFKVLQALACVISGRLRKAYIQLLGVTDAGTD
jgi:CRP/FNR family transcriptional regulator, cyclic AMP receptor protein